MSGPGFGVPLRVFLSDPVHWLSFGFGVGLIPFAPGTWGSLLALGIFLLLPPLSTMTLIGLILAMLVVGVGLCGLSARRLGMSDPSAIVWDEMTAMFLVAAVLPRSTLWLVAGFLAFRLFDIWKPWPIRDLDHSLPGGLGIMLDDVVAAVYAVVCVKLCHRLVTAM